VIGHRRFAVLAAGAIDFELTPSDRADLDRHLQACAGCREVAWRLRSDASAIALRPRRQAPPDMRERFEAGWLPRVERRKTHGVRLALVAAAALLATATAAIIVGGGRSQVVDPTPSSVPSPSASAGLPIVGSETDMELSHGAFTLDADCAGLPETACASDVHSAFASIWTTSTDKIIRLDPSTGAVVARVGVGNFVIRLASDDQWIWATRRPGELARIDPATNALAGRFQLPGLPAGLAVSHGSVWVVDEASDALLKVDPGDGAVVLSIPVGESPWEVAATSDALWVADRWGSAVTEVDPERGVVVATYPVPGARPQTFWDYGDGVVAVRDVVWVASGQRVSRFDRATATFVGQVTPAFPHLATTSDRLWLAGAANGQLQEVDPLTLEVVAGQSVNTSWPQAGVSWETSIAATDGAVWIRSYLDDRLIRIDLAR
jgi:glutamine cyclotransferase